MKHSQVLVRLQRLLAHNSPSKRENKLASEIAVQLQELGISSKIYEIDSGYDGDTGNLLAVIEASDSARGTLTFNAHMDTVETTDPPNYVIDDNKIKARGEFAAGLDDKVGIAAIIQAVAEIKEKKAKYGRINLLFTVSEEIGLMGAKHFDIDLIRDSYVFVMDSHGAPGVLINKAPSQASIDFIVSGKPAHSGVEPEKGVSAVIAASKAIWNMKLGRIDEETTANVGIISGGTARNIVPGSVKVKAEARSLNNEKLKDQVGHMIKVFKEACRSEGCKLSYELVEEYQAYCLGEKEEIVKMAVKAIENSGLTPVIESTGGGSDTNIFNNQGIPAVVLSCGYYDPHTPNEWASVDELEKIVEILVNLATQ